MLVPSGGRREAPPGRSRLIAIRATLRSAALALALTFLIGACEPSIPEPLRIESHGVLRHHVVAMPFDRTLDPTSEYTSMGFALLSNLLVRPLMSYRHIDGVAGTEVVPDLAVDMPEVSEDGLRYEFTLRNGVRFGPPLDREITSRDVLYAFERLGTPSAGARYEFYFTSAIEGLSEFAAGESETITGIETPDDDTIVFHLRRRTGDFLNRLAMPAVAPMPEEIAGCFTEPASYGRYLVATGPYMIAGSGGIGTACDELAPAPGFDPERELTLVRNPNYDPGTDDPRIRSARFTRYELKIETDVEKIYRQIERGRVDLTSGTPPLSIVRRYAARARLRPTFHVEPGGRIWYISMNLTQPPFDDVHVRRAANYVMDKDLLVRSWGGEIHGDVATHVLPDDMLGGELRSFDPYRTRDNAGNAALARQEMRLSDYDSNKDGLCDALECGSVVHITRDSEPWKTMSVVMRSSFRKIGIELDNRLIDDVYGRIQDLPNEIPITSAPGWVKDYPEPFSFVGFLFDGRNIRHPANTNYSMLGFSKERAEELGIDFPAKPVPSVDTDIDRCVALLDPEARRDCWASLDRKLMTKIVPWIPYLEANKLIVVSEAVDPYEYDQFSGEISFAHIGVDRSKVRP